MEFLKYDIVKIETTKHFTEKAVVKVGFSQFGATLRVILLCHINGICFETATITANNTVFPNEILAQRIRAIPLIQSAAKTGETYYLHIALPRSADQSRRDVMSQEIVDSKGRPAPVTEDLPLFSMEQGQTVSFSVKTGIHNAYEDAIYQFAIKPFFDPENLTVTFETTESYDPKTVLNLAIDEIKKFIVEIKKQLDSGIAQATKYDGRIDITVFGIPIVVTYLLARIGQERGYIMSASKVHPLKTEVNFTIYDENAVQILSDLCDEF